MTAGLIVLAVLAMMAWAVGLAFGLSKWRSAKELAQSRSWATYYLAMSAATFALIAFALALE